jgi:branched-chain amino acid transport system permease protein
MRQPLSGVAKKVWLIILIVAPLAIPFLKYDYAVYLAYMTFLSITLASAWNMLGGFGGQVSMGNAAFFGIGMYVTAIVGKIVVVGRLELSWLVVFGGVISIGIAIILSGAFKLRGVYFTMSTLFLNEVIRVLMLNWATVTNGPEGLNVQTPPPFSYTPYFYASYVIALASIIISYWLSISTAGVALKCIREDEDAALSLGINSFKYKFFAMCLCAFFTGAAGAYHAAFVSFIEPFSAFKIDWSINPLFGTIIGGIGTLWGPIIGAVILTQITESLIPLGAIRLIAIGLILIAFMLYAPAGIYGSLKIRWLKGRLKSVAIKPPSIMLRSQASGKDEQGRI